MISRRILLSGVATAAMAPAFAAAQQRLEGATGKLQVVLPEDANREEDEPASRGAPIPSGPPTTEEFFDDPTTVGAAMSPDGKTVAVLRQKVTRPEYRLGAVKYQSFVDFREIDDINSIMTVNLQDVEAEKIAWASNGHLLVWIWTSEGRTDDRRTVGRRLLVSISRDRSRILQLMRDGDNAMTRFVSDRGNVMDLLPNDDEFILVRLFNSQTGAGLYKVSVINGSMSQVEMGVPGTIDWLIQDGRAVLRRDINSSEKVISIMSRPAGETKWTEVRKISANLNVQSEFEIMGVSETAGVIRVLVYPEGNDKRVIQNFNLITNTWGEVLTHGPTDAEDWIGDASGKYLGAQYLRDTIYYEAVDPGLNEGLKILTGAFPNCSVQVIDISTDLNSILAVASGPRQPGLFVYFNRELEALALLGVTKPWLHETRLQPCQAFDTRRPDGKVVRCYLTGGSGRDKPLVVLPHGGPELRDSMDFDAIAQVLAAQGWLVLQPNFRGSRGFGRDFINSGRRNWGGAVMEDIETAMDLVIASGRADRNKVAIVGGSFGGYSALMCGVRRPNFYKAVVSIAGVADLVEMMKTERLEGLDSPSWAYWVKTLGDPATETARLREHSPVTRAENMTAPVLLIHGLEDTTVVPEQSRIMSRRLKSLNKPVELLEIPNMPHGWSRPVDAVVTFDKVIAFLKPLLG